MKPKIIYFRESLLQSVLADISTFFSMGALFWFNHNFISGNNFVDFIIVIGVFTLPVTKITQVEFHSKEEMIDYLKNK